MSRVLKFNYDKETDNIETVQGLNDAVQSWLDSLSMPFDAVASIENFEFRSRDGFSAHSHNRGGQDLICITSIAYLMGSGEHLGLSIEDWTEKQWDETRKHVKQNQPELDTDSDAFYDATYEACTGDYDCIAWRVRVMYEGQGVLRVYAGYDFDAPYFRWNKSPSFETEIRFKTISGLNRQLKALTKKLEASQNETKLKGVK